MWLVQIVCCKCWSDPYLENNVSFWRDDGADLIYVLDRGGALILYWHLTVLGWQLDSMILRIFSKVNDSVILKWHYSLLCNSNGFSAMVESVLRSFQRKKQNLWSFQWDIWSLEDLMDCCWFWCIWAIISAETFFKAFSSSYILD